MSKTLSSRLWLVLMDGQTHHSTEFMHFVSKGIPPQVAVRSYINARRRSPGCDKRKDGSKGKPKGFDPETMPKEHMVIVGRRRAAVVSMLHLHRRGFITFTRHSPAKGPKSDPDDFSIQITPAGWVHLVGATNNGAARGIMGSVIKEMRRCLQAKPCPIAISVKINNQTEGQTEGAL